MTSTPRSSTAAHTPTPWTACKHGSCQCGYIFGDGGNVYNAYDDMVAALQEIAIACESRAHPAGKVLISELHVHDMRDIAGRARIALAKATGQEK